MAPHSIRVLIVEDDPRLAFVLKVQLEIERDFEVVATVGDAGRAFEMTLQERPDVTFLDIGLPDLDGVTAVRRILDAWPDAVIVAHSGNLRDLDRATDAGVTQTVLKGDPRQNLADVLRDASQKRARTP